MNEHVKTVDLGWCIAKLILNRDGTANRLLIVSPADASENVYQPAESVSIYGTYNVDALLKFLTEHVKVRP